MKTLVIYFTRSGNTKVVAEKLANKIDCDIEEIVDNKKRTGFIGSAGAYLSPINKKTTIKDIRSDLGKYDLVIIGTPVWWYTISPALTEFLSRYKEKMTDVALMYTCDKDMKINAEADVKDLFGKAAVSTIGIESGSIKDKTFEKKLDEFIKGAGL